jgi:hypothetical protein
MAITYTWAITGMKVADVNGRTDHVVQTHWEKIGTDENGNTGKFSGATPFKPNPNQVDFIEHNDLTQEIVLSWIQPLVTGGYEAHVNSVIAEQIAAKQAPTTQSTLSWLPLPRVTPTE